MGLVGVKWRSTPIRSTELFPEQPQRDSTGGQPDDSQARARQLLQAADQDSSGSESPPDPPKSRVVDTEMVARVWGCLL